MPKITSRALLSLGLLVLACKAPPDRTQPIAEFGVFFGGQVQKLMRLPLQSDPSLQMQGFRLEYAVPPTVELAVEWEVTMARAGRRTTDALGRNTRARAVRYGKGRWKPGETRFEHVVAFSPQDPVGLWNVRVTVEGRVVLDRPFTVYTPRKTRN